VKLTDSPFICVICEKPPTHSELIHKIVNTTGIICVVCVADAKLGRLVRSAPPRIRLTTQGYSRTNSILDFIQDTKDEKETTERNP
jgi:hypothetical protein